MVKKSVKKSLLKSKKLILAISILYIISTMLFSLTSLTFDDLAQSNEKYTKESNREDFRLIEFNVFGPVYTKDVYEDIEQKHHVNLEKSQYFTQTESENLAYDVYRYYPDNKINKYKIEEGKAPVKDNEVMVSVMQANAKGWKLGDEIKLDGHEFTISGIAYFPTYASPINPMNGKAIVPKAKEFGPLVLSSKGFDSIKPVDKDITTYYSARYTRPVSEAKSSKIQKKISENTKVDVPLLDEYGQPQISDKGEFKTQEIKIFPFVMDNEMNSGLYMFDQEISGDQLMFKTLATLISAITVALVVVLINNIFKNQRRELGILKAEGVSNSELTRYYLLYITLILFVTSIIGLGLGAFFAPKMQDLLMTNYSIPLSVKSANTELIVTNLTSLLIKAVVISLIVYVLAIHKNIRKQPLLLIKNVESDKKPKLNISKITRKMKFITKYKVNILIRNFSKTILLTLGIIISSFMLLLGTVMLTSVSNMMNNTYTEMYTYDYQATFSATYKAKQEKDSIINKATTVSSVTGDTTEYDKDARNSVTLYALDQDNKYINLFDQKGKEIDKSTLDGGLIISGAIADTYKLEIGDTITVDNPFDTGQDVDFEVTNITNDGFTPYVFTDIDYLQDKLDIADDYANGIVGKGDKEKEFKKKDPEVTYNETIDMQKELENQLGVIYSVIAVITVISSIIAFVTLVTISALVISSNRKTISVMKVLGYTNKEIKKMITSPYKWIVIVVYFVSIPFINKAINVVIANAMRDMDISMSFNIDWKYALAGFVIIYVVYYFSMLMAYRSIKKINLSESLKADE